MLIKAVEWILADPLKSSAGEKGIRLWNAVEPSVDLPALELAFHGHRVWIRQHKTELRCLWNLVFPPPLRGNPIRS